MTLTEKQVKRLKLSEPQKYALLHIGNAQVGQENHEMVGVCTQESKGNYYRSDYYWSGCIYYKPSDAVTHSAQKTIRFKTFKTMEKKGYITLSDTDPVNNGSLKAQLTDMGWEIFTVLALGVYEQAKVYDARHSVVYQETLEKLKREPTEWQVNLTIRRKRVIPVWEHSKKGFAIMAHTEEEAIAAAQKKYRDKLLTDEVAWNDDNHYYRREASAEYWGEDVGDALEEESTEYVDAGFDDNATTAKSRDDSEYTAKYKVEYMLNGEGLEKPIWQFDSLKAYFEDEKRSPYEMDKLIRESGGIRLDDAMAEDEPEDADESDDPSDDESMGRFALMDLN